MILYVAVHLISIVVVFNIGRLAEIEKEQTSVAKMAVPPAYADLGKSARDIFGKGYGEYWEHTCVCVYVQ